MLEQSVQTSKKVIALLIGGVIFCTPVMAEYGLNMTEGVTSFSREIYELHMIIFYVCLVIAIGVFAAMFYSIYAHRKSKGHKPAQFFHSTKAEIIWTVSPFIILIAMAYPATKTLINLEDTSNSDMTVKITGYQWKWKYDYIGEDYNFYSMLADESNAARMIDSGIDPYSVENYLLDVDKPLVLPTNRKIRFLVTADDVIHSWWVPDLGWKKDAVPGFVNEAWTQIDTPGTYRGQCAELCGKDHGFMPIVIVAKTPEEFDKWLAEKKAENNVTALVEHELLRKDATLISPIAQIEGGSL